MIGDPDARTPRGNISGSVTLGSNASIGDYTVTLATSQTSQVNVFRAGDYIQFGSGATSKLHMIVDDANSDSSGNVNVNIEPAIKTAVSSGQTVVYSNPRGVFRMVNPEISWDADELSKYGISFVIMEAQ